MSMKILALIRQDFILEIILILTVAIHCKYRQSIGLNDVSNHANACVVRFAMRISS